MLVVTDIDQQRLDRAKTIYSIEEAEKQGVKLLYVNTREIGKPEDYLMSLTHGAGFDDVFVFAAVKPVVEQADKILAVDGCLNFFAGPSDPNFKAELNFYNVHYAFTHIVGTSGGNTDDMNESLQMMSSGKINPSAMITHVGGLDAVIETTKHLPEIPGGKKLIYTNISMPLTALWDLEAKGKNDIFYANLNRLVKSNNGLWSVEAEKYLLENAKSL